MNHIGKHKKWHYRNDTALRVVFRKLQTPLRFNQNVLAFDSKRTCVLSKTHLRLNPNAKAFQEVQKINAYLAYLFLSVRDK